MMETAVDIATILYREINIPFRTVFRHASADRAETSAVWVQVTTKNGDRGFGEGCPREYVTGESIASTIEFIESCREAILAEISNIESLKRFVSENHNIINKNPSAWCAVELAILDLFGQSGSRSVEACLSLPELSADFEYSAVLGASDLSRFSNQLSQYLSNGFTEFKIKLSGNMTQDRERLKIFQAAVPSCCQVRADANNLWKDYRSAISYLANLDVQFSAIEEPISAYDYVGLAKIAEALNIPVILDESFLGVEHLEELRSFKKNFIINLRVSKMGGLIRSLLVVDSACGLGIPLIIGAQVGETSLLTRAGLTIAEYAREILIAQEGAYGTYLLEHDVCDKPVMFGKNGKLNNATKRFAQQPGFGLEITEEYRY